MELRSPDFEHDKLIPSRYTCDGEDINPELEILDAPSEAKSLVLIMEDPDASIGTWVHWTLWNIDPLTETIAAGNVPIGTMQGMTNFDRPGYGGPCPHSGTHHYVFKLYALNDTLDLSSSIRAEDLREAMKDKVIAECELVGLYAREEEI